MRGRYASEIARYQVADHWIANETGRLLSYRIGWMQEAGGMPNYEASVVKVFATEVAQRIVNTAMNTLGLGGLLRGSAGAPPAGGAMPEAYMEMVAPTIYSGSSEIQRNIIAQRGLGLPRD
jgi:alkylation response protein AidB-like acyl-CoA dehydrogenase